MADVIFLFRGSKEVPCYFTDEQLKKIGEIPGVGRFVQFDTEEELLRSGADAEVLFTWGGSGKMPVQFCMQSEKLKWFHSFSAGLEPVLSSPIAGLPILVSNSSGIHATAISEHVMGVILAFNRDFKKMFELQRRHVWGRGEGLSLLEAYGRTLGIVGAGNIGTQIAKRAAAFGMYTIGLKRSPAPLEFFDEVVGREGLGELLARSDYVVIATPLTKETERMIRAEHFMRMKKTALFINVGRGAVVDQEALVQALNTKTIAGAALDVMYPEPLDPESPLWDMEHVILSPHCSAVSPLLTQFAIDFFCRSLRLYLAGKPVPNTVSV